MQIALAQLRGMMLYEFKMHWRRKVLWVMMLAFMTITVVALLIFIGSIRSKGAAAEEMVRPYVSAYAVLASWMPLSVGLALILPVMVADTIPLDRQYGVRDLLDSLPLSRAVYLTGKLVGAWAAVLAGLFVALTVSALVWLLIAGGFDLGPFAEMALVGAGSLAVMNGGLGVLVAVGQPSRRRAIVLVIALLAIVLLVLPTLINNWDLRATYGSQISNPVRMPILNRYFFGIQVESNLTYDNPTLNPSPELMRDTILAGLAEVVAAWVLAWAWLRWRSGRA